MKISIFLTISLVLTSLVVGMAFGYYISPEYKESMYIESKMGLGEADRYIDLRYINAMISHHRAAMILADKVADITERKAIKELADEIRKNEPVLIDELYAWKKEWYKDTKSVPDPIVVNLGAKDEKTDLRFLNALIYHHEEGIRMTQEIKLKSSRNEILDNAQAVENFLSSSVLNLKSWREGWYKIK